MRNREKTTLPTATTTSVQMHMRSVDAPLWTAVGENGSTHARTAGPPVQLVCDQTGSQTGQAASKQNKLDQVEQELGKVTTLIKDPKLSSIVMNPHVKRSLKQKTFNDALAKAKVSPITINLINVLADNGRLTLTGDVIAAFGKMMSAHRGEVICSVTTAQPLDAASLGELKVALNGFLQKGETIKLETKSDPAILGGMIVSIGDKYVDMSTKTKIQKLTKLIKET
ncbi:ATP synthase subunit O, mitochondrial [Larimichthys crocea]|uniref:Uncharacterized protein n=1 Tax=Larimichthys crocea TaxID=215358 RepID=A0ACD3RD38_LARCR|nr:ATP synthase subunit O, mitochondrial [Larimichthys crocea]